MLRPLIRPIVRPLVRRVTAPSFGWSPRVLFAAGEQGAWYDPSDLSTLFQDSAGTTPVTALGQPVGLILDKRKGLVRGPELVTDGGFDSGTVWWDVVNGTAVINSGALVCTDTGGTITLYKNEVTTAGKWYEINLDLVSASATLKVYVGGALVSFASTPGRKRAIALAVVGTQVEFQIGGGLGATFTIDNISVRELPGNHASQPTATARPTLQADANGRRYLQFDGVDDLLSGNPFLTHAAHFAAVAAQADSLASDTALFVPAQSALGPSVAYLFASSTGAAGVRYGDDANPSVPVIKSASYVVSAGVPFVASVGFNGTSRIGYCNGVAVTAPNTTVMGATTLTQSRIGMTLWAGSKFQGRFYGALAIQRNLSDVEKMQTNRSLASKAGVTL